MKRILLTTIALLMGGVANAGDWVVTEDAHTESFAVSGPAPTLKLDNIWGDVRVQPGAEGEIIVRYTERRAAPDQGRYDRSLESLRLRSRTDKQGVYLWVGGPDPDNWHDSERCRKCRVDYQFELRVPPGTRLDIGTINDGAVDVRGITGRITAGNVNGPISIDGLRNCAALSNVNGRIEVRFAATPAQDCRIQTVNGDVLLGLPDGSGLDLAMDLFNGSLRSDLPVHAVAVPARVEHTESNGRHQYRIEQAAGLRIAAGGPQFTVSSINGDIRIQKSP